MIWLCPGGMAAMVESDRSKLHDVLPGADISADAAVDRAEESLDEGDARMNDPAVRSAHAAIKALLAHHSAESMLRALDIEMARRPGRRSRPDGGALRGSRDPVYLSRQRALAKLAMLRS